MLCLAIEICPRAHRQNKDHIKPDQLSNPHCYLTGVKGMRSFVLFLTFKSTISIMIKFILNLLTHLSLASFLWDRQTE